MLTAVHFIRALAAFSSPSGFVGIFQLKAVLQATNAQPAKPDSLIHLLLSTQWFQLTPTVLDSGR